MTTLCSLTWWFFLHIPMYSLSASMFYQTSILSTWKSGVYTSYTQHWIFFWLANLYVFLSSSLVYLSVLNDVIWQLLAGISQHPLTWMTFRSTAQSFVWQLFRYHGLIQNGVKLNGVRHCNVWYIPRYCVEVILLLTEKCARFGFCIPHKFFLVWSVCRCRCLVCHNPHPPPPSGFDLSLAVYDIHCHFVCQIRG